MNSKGKIEDVYNDISKKNDELQKSIERMHSKRLADTEYCQALEDHSDCLMEAMRYLDAASNLLREDD